MKKTFSLDDTFKMYCCALCLFKFKRHKQAVLKLRAVEYAILFLIYVYFNEAFCQKIYEITIIFKYKFLKFISRCSILQSIRISNLVVLKCDTKAKFERMFNIFFKKLSKEVLKI